MELMQLINDANNKMQSAMMSMSKEVYDQLVEIYNIPEGSAAASNNPTPTPKPANPYITNLGQSNTQGASNIFGGGFSSNPTGGSIFGGSTGGNQQNSGIFGGGGAATSGGNIFAQAQPQQPSSGQNIFGMSSTFTQPQTQTSIFNSTSTFGGNSVTPQTSSIFAQPPATTNVFQQTQQPPQGNIFQQQPSGNIFSQQQQTQQNPFPAAPTASQGVFGSSPFAPVPQQQPPTNVFAAQMNLTPDPTSASPFIQVPQQQPASIFAPTPTQTPFGGSQQPMPSQAQTQFTDSAYTKMDQLTKEQLDAFQANTFELGKIPTCPPPKEFCT